MSVTVTINGKPYQAEPGEYVLDIARRSGVPIPSFCHHASLSGQGCCRVCIVEVDEGWGNKVVVSCVYPVTKDCQVSTESEKIKRLRRSVLSMLAGRAPAAESVGLLCKSYQVEPETRYTPAKQDEKCILCGLCAKACAELGAGAISTVNRGIDKKVSTPFDEPSADCIGCGSCAAVCPTGAITMSEDGDSRTIWGRKFELLRCASCGKPFAAREEYDYSRRRAAEEGGKTEPETEPLCESCRRRSIAGVFAATFEARKM